MRESIRFTTDRSGNRSVVIDARCLQDPNYVDRGVGRVAANLLRHKPQRLGYCLIGLIDLTMPKLHAEDSDLFDVLRPNVQFHDLRGIDCFVSPSPMTHDPLFASYLISMPDPLKAAVIYDFIPHEFPEHYLPDTSTRQAYYTCLRWLSRFDLFMPISHASAGALKCVLGIEDDRIFVSGAPLDPAFERAGKAMTAPRHVLVIGGGDPRKNVECVVRAHAIAAALQGSAIPLVITGHYSAAQVSAFRDIAASLGGARHLLRVPGHVDEAELVDLYRASVCVIAPSRAEGFDLPLVEAMASGVPAMASDIPAHRELVTAADCRFDCDDHTRLAMMLERLIGEPGWRTRVIDGQADVWPRYRSAAVAERFWQPIEAALATLPGLAPAVLRGRRPRVAFLSPLPPDRTGIADYTAATCAELGRLTELHVFSETTMPGPLPGAATVRPLTPLANVSNGYDRVVNVMGNSDFHLRIFEQMQRYGGACISHDSRMLGFYRILLGMDRATRVASEELQRPITETDINRWLNDEATLEATHYGEMVTAADPLMVHSRAAARLICDRFDVEPVVLPFCIQRPWSSDQLAPAARAAARRRLGLSDDEIVIATFGHVHRTKAPIESIWALEILRGWGLNASLHFVGADSEDHCCRALAAELGLDAHVRFLGEFVGEATLRDYLLGADLGIQLRLTFLGHALGVSGALVDCIGAGLPVVSNASLAEAMEAPSYVQTVPDHLSPLLIAEALAGLLDAGLARVRPEAERQAYSEAHSFKVYSRQLCAALELEVGG